MKHFIVLELISGAMDGFYTDKESADSVVPVFKERHPKGVWVVVEVVTPSKDMRIFDTMWHLNRLGLGAHAPTE